MNFKIIGNATDKRTGALVLYAQATIEAYLSLIGPEFDAFKIQRKRVQHRGYARMKEDIKSGTLLPSITLAVKNEWITQVEQGHERGHGLEELLQVPGHVDILDGLQRTHLLTDLKTEGHPFDPDQKLILEFWLEREVKNLIYRIIVLNSGQKPMSMRHQIELLFSTTKDDLKKRIPAIDIMVERDDVRRTKGGKYPLERLALSYYAYITKSAEVDKENIIAQKLVEDGVLEGGEDELGNNFERFTVLLGIFVEIDQEVFRRCTQEEFMWFGSDNVMISLFAAAADFSSNEERERRVRNALERLRHRLRTAQPTDDVLGFTVYKDTVVGIPSRRTNVGYATRKLLSAVFKEYFRDEGQKALAEHWAAEAT